MTHISISHQSKPTCQQQMLKQRGWKPGNVKQKVGNLEIKVEMLKQKEVTLKIEN